MLRFFWPVTAVIILALGLWPPVGSLAELTGETERLRQVRGVLHWAYTAVRPQPQLAPTAELAVAAPTLYGVNTFLEQEALPEVRAQSLALIRAAGFGAIRQQFVWEDIEIHGKGDFIDRRNDPAGVDAWAKYDNIVDLAAAEGLTIIARLDNPPAWTRALTNTIGAHAPPDNFADYGDFVAAVAERYAGRITYYQLWNEPNIYPEWGEQPANPEAFTELFCLGYRRVKMADPAAVILSPALSPTIAIDGRNLNNLIYFERMLAAGAGDCFDILAAQAYGLWSGPSDRRLRPTFFNYQSHLYMRDILVRHGYATRPVWISEMGWNVVPDQLPAPFGRVTEEEQAAYAVAAYERARQEWPWVGVINYWFFKRAADFEVNEPFYYFRLLEPDFTPLPVFSALRDYLPTIAEQPAAPESTIWFFWQSVRPGLILLGGGWLLLWLLLALAPHGEENRQISLTKREKSAKSA
jgi:polysaccharide biosynthesis protein PslG